MKSYKYAVVGIQGFMVQDLKLTGDELIIYAIIFQFTMQPRYYWVINYDFIVAFTRLSIDTIDSILEDLKECNLIDYDGMRARAKINDEE